MMKAISKVNFAIIVSVLASLFCVIGVAFANTNGGPETFAPISEAANLIVFGFGLICVGVIIRKMNVSDRMPNQLSEKRNFEASKTMAS